MLAWALWLAFYLLQWLRWGWGCFARGGIWRKIEVAKKPADSNASSPEEPGGGTG
jgi:hypothetical protein